MADKCQCWFGRTQCVAAGTQRGTDLGGEVAEDGEGLAPHVPRRPGQARDDPGHPKQVPDDHGGAQREPQAARVVWRQG
jgi:hypothetical protein